MAEATAAQAAADEARARGDADVAEYTRQHQADEAARTFYHVHHSTGSVTLKVERNSRGYNWEIRIEVPIDQAADAISTGDRAIADAKALDEKLRARFGAPEGG